MMWSSSVLDICLPAVFMPTRTGHVFSPKAHSYFHPPGKSIVNDQKGWYLRHLNFV